MALDLVIFYGSVRHDRQGISRPGSLKVHASHAGIGST